MVVLTVGLAVVAAATAVNLLFTVGVIRRLRQHAAMLAAGAAGNQPSVPAAGSRIRAFNARTVDGDEVTLASLPARSVAVFLSPGCPPCEEQLPALAARLRAPSYTRTANLVVIAGGGDTAADMIEQLRSLAIVIHEPPESTTVQAAFGVSAFPVGLLVEDGVITDVVTDFERLPEPVSLSVAA